MTDDHGITDEMRGVPDPNIKLAGGASGVDRASVHMIETPMTDRERAELYRGQMVNALNDVIEVIDDAKKHGLRIGFQLSPPDPLGRAHIGMLEILKEL